MLFKERTVPQNHKHSIRHGTRQGPRRSSLRSVISAGNDIVREMWASRAFARRLFCESFFCDFVSLVLVLSSNTFSPGSGEKLTFSSDILLVNQPHF